MAEISMTKRCQRLGLTPEQVGVGNSLELLQITLSSNPADYYDRAWNKFSRADDRSVLAIRYYILGDDASSKEHGVEVLDACKEFFFGAWRSEFLTPDDKIDPLWWKRRFVWMQVFEAALLWGSVLNQWAFLQEIGVFPEADSCVSDGYKEQERDLYVAIGAFLSGAPASELGALLGKAETGSRKSCKYLVLVMRACIDRDAALIQKSLLDFLKYYKKNDFPKEDITKKISTFGTFFVHWAIKEGLTISVPDEFVDHVVRLE